MPSGLSLTERIVDEVEFRSSYFPCDNVCLASSGAFGVEEGLGNREKVQFTSMFYKKRVYQRASYKGISQASHVG